MPRSLSTKRIPRPPKGIADQRRQVQVDHGELTYAQEQDAPTQDGIDLPGNIKSLPIIVGFVNGSQFEHNPLVSVGDVVHQMRGSGGCDSGFGQVLLRCLSESVLWRVQPPIKSGAIEIPGYLSKTLNCTPARTMHSCEFFNPLSNSTVVESIFGRRCSDIPNGDRPGAITAET